MSSPDCASPKSVKPERVAADKSDEFAKAFLNGDVAEHGLKVTALKGRQQLKLKAADGAKGDCEGELEQED